MGANIREFLSLGYLDKRDTASLGPAVRIPVQVIETAMLREDVHNPPTDLVTFDDGLVYMAFGKLIMGSVMHIDFITWEGIETI